MIVIAIDISASIEKQFLSYQDHIFRVIENLKPPIQVIYWSTWAEAETYNTISRKLVDFKWTGGTQPECFMKLLSDSEPIDLYLFTDGEIQDHNVERSKKVLENKKLSFSRVRLYYIGEEKYMNLKLTNIFHGFVQEIHINDRAIGQTDPEFDFDHVDYDYILKDDSFKATILSMINAGKVKQTVLKKKVCDLQTRLLKDYSKNKTSIKSFYEAKDIEGCVVYVKGHCNYSTKVDLQRKFSEILKLFEPNINTYSLDVFKATKKLPLLEYKEPELEMKTVTCDILYENCKTVCFLVKKFKKDTILTKEVENNDANIYISRKTIKNPFQVLDSPDLRQKVVRLVEPYVLDYNTYKLMEEPNISPFTREFIQGVYVLSNGTIAISDLVKHNNYILSTLFQNKLPGKSILWHLVFLYVLAVDKFQHLESLLFEEIRTLSQYFDYFITLSPYLNPPVVEKLDVCFWYIANVCHRAFPNSSKNVLRGTVFNEGAFLQFYRNVYDKEYQIPKDMSRWELWKIFCEEPTVGIFKVLTNYVDFKVYSDVTSNDYGIVLFQGEKSKKPLQKLYFDAGVETILHLYEKFMEARGHTHYENVSNLEGKSTLKLSQLMQYKNNADSLHHVKINIKTCHPYVICPLSKKHWRTCVGEYDITKD